MPVPKRKHSRSRRDLKHANKHLEFSPIAYCQTSQEPTLPHAVCLTSGYYKGVKVLRTKADRAHSRAQARQAIQARRMARQSMTGSPAVDVESSETANS
jgi:large subunit ribosomal protein L32